MPLTSPVFSRGYQTKDKSNANPYCNDESVKAIAEAAVPGAQSEAFVVSSDRVGRWAKLVATKDNLAGCAARCAKSLANRSESVEIAKAIVHALPMGEDVDEGEVVAEVLKAFVVDEPSARRSSSNGCGEAHRVSHRRESSS